MEQSKNFPNPEEEMASRLANFHKWMKDGAPGAFGASGALIQPAKLVKIPEGALNPTVRVKEEGDVPKKASRRHRRNVNEKKKRDEARNDGSVAVAAPDSEDDDVIVEKPGKKKPKVEVEEENIRQTVSSGSTSSGSTSSGSTSSGSEKELIKKRVFILSEFLEDRSLLDTFDAILGKYGSNWMKFSELKFWFDRFEAGNFNLEMT